MTYNDKIKTKLNDFYSAFKVESIEDKKYLLLDRVIDIDRKFIHLLFMNESSLSDLEKLVLVQSENDGEITLNIPLQRFYQENNIHPCDYKQKFTYLNKIGLPFIKYGADGIKNIVHENEKIAVNVYNLGYIDYKIS